MAIIKIVTHFGDLVVVLPLALAALLWLAHIGSKHLIFYWVASLLTCTLITIALKMYFLSCPGGHFDLRSPSGHSSLSILVYGALGTIAAKGAGKVKRLVVIGVIAALVIAIAVSRSILGAHTAPEIIAGLVIGGLALIPFSQAYLRIQAVKLAPIHLLAILTIVPFAATVESPDTEKILGRAAAQLQEIAPMCQKEAGASDELAQ